MPVNIGNQTSAYRLTNATLHILGEFSTVISSSFGIASSTDANERLVVAGSVYSSSNGLAFGLATGGSKITIESTGSILGNTGVFLPSNGAILTNAGSITGQSSDAVNLSTQDDISVFNSGSISGANSGLVSFGTGIELINSGTITGNIGVSANGDTTIYNSGLIAGQSAAAGVSGTGVKSGVTVGQTTILYNSGTVSGDAASYNGGVGRDVVYNSGVMDGSVVLDSGDDVYRASGDGLVQGNVRGGGGNDDLRGASAADELIGGNGNDKIKGRGGEDTLEGGNGRDIIFGGDGDDVIEGGNAGDLMLGGAGRDEFLFTDTGDIGTSGATRDEIRDFEQGIDIINLAAMVGPDFIFLGTGSFTGGAAPELRLAEAGGSTFVQLDYDGDGSQDGRMLVRGVVDMLETDFLL